MPTCDHVWYEEGTGEGAFRCCKRCGLVLVQKSSNRSNDNRPDITPEQVRALRSRSGMTDTNIEAVESTGDDPNQMVSLESKARSQRKAWVILSVFCTAIGIFQAYTKGGVSVGVLLGLLAGICGVAFLSSRLKSLRRSIDHSSFQ